MDTRVSTTAGRTTYIQPEGFEDFKQRYDNILFNETSRELGGGLFCGLDREVMETILCKSYIYRYDIGDQIYWYRDPVFRIPLFVILEGSFLVSRIIDQKLIDHDTYGPGLIFGEAELLQRDVAIDMNDGHDKISNVARGQVKCISDPDKPSDYGKVLIIEPSAIIDSEAHLICFKDRQLASNMARIESWKLIRIGSAMGQKDRQRPRIHILRYLVKREKEFLNDNPRFRDVDYQMPVTQKEIASGSHTKPQTVNNLFSKYLKEKQITYCRDSGKISVPSQIRFSTLLEAELGHTGRDQSD